MVVGIFYLDSKPGLAIYTGLAFRVLDLPMSRSWDEGVLCLGYGETLRLYSESLLGLDLILGDPYLGCLSF
jgi:hypothetical protein